VHNHGTCSQERLPQEISDPQLLGISPRENLDRIDRDYRHEAAKPAIMEE
jgi:hypothetical protein